MQLSFNKLSLKELNRQKVYAALYHEPQQSKQQLARFLNMSLSTVDSNIKNLLQSNLIEEGRTLESTGGRKAQGYQIKATAHYAIGCFLLDEKVIATAVDLNGRPLWEEHFSLDHHAISTDEYWAQLKEHLVTLGKKHHLQKSQCLGLAFALQGTVTSNHVLSVSGESARARARAAEGAAVTGAFGRGSVREVQPDHVNYGILLLKTGQQLTLEQIQAHFSLPCSLYHDAKAAAFAELWEKPQIDNAALFLLNQNLGGALIFNNMVHYGNQGRGGLVEHVKVGHEGRLCYCGNHDCLECYCSKQALEHDTALDYTEFFRRIHSQDAEQHYPELWSLWQKYLGYLGISIYNISRLMDGKIILTGAMAPYFQHQDLLALKDHINRYTDNFSVGLEDLILSPRSDAVVALGAGRHLINAYLELFEANPLQDQCYHAQNLTLNLDDEDSATSDNF